MSTPDTTLAIALVVDASFTLLSNWKLILQLYVSPLVRRVAETHPNCPYTLGFVTYGSSETSPSPILCKKFFQESSLVINAMREDPPKHFRLGSTTTGGSKGLATLEGLVAGIEMFDTLLKTRDFKSHRSPVFHLIHLSASVADDSLHPQWNDLSELDDTTWEKLPSELSNRDINFSSIVLNLKNTKCSELHSSVPAPKKVNPWFPVDNNHSVLLSGFNVSPPSKGTKRAGDSSTADKPPEKKPRQTFAVSPVLANSKPADKPSTANIPPESQALWPTTNFPVSSLPPAYQAVLAEFRKEEERIRRMQAAAQAAVLAGQHEKVAPIKEEMQKAFSNIQKTRAAVMTLAARLNQGNGSQPFRPTPGQRLPEASVVATANQAVSSQNSPPVALKPGNTVNTDTTQRPLTHTPTSSVDNNTAVLDPRNSSQSELGHNTASNSSAPNLAGITQQSKMQMLTPDVAAQMHKLIEQSERSGRLQQPLTGANAAAMSAQTQNTSQAFSQSQLTNVTPDAAGPILGGNVSANPMTGGSKPLVAPTGAKGPPAWQGVFFLPADPQTGRRELKVQVAMFSNAQSLSAARPDTWPPLMQLANTRDPLVHAIDFQIWCKQRQPLVCAVHPAAGGNEANSANFRLLFETLQNSQCYAVARWAISNGAPSINALFFAHNNTALAAAICPITGIPELPKHGLALKLPLSETQRQVVLTAYARAGNTNPSLLNANRPGMMPSQQHLGGIAGAVRPGVGSAQLGQQSQPAQPINPVATNALMGLGNFTGNGPMMPNMGSSVNFPNMMTNNLGRQPSGAGMGGNRMPSISPEIMQSFMQRNAEGNGGQGPGMG